MIDHEKREIHAPVLYLGVEGAGKATNLDQIYTRTSGGDESPGRAYWEENGLDVNLGPLLRDAEVPALRARDYT